MNNELIERVDHCLTYAALTQQQDAEPVGYLSDANLVADALEAANWSGAPIGNKCFIRSAIEHLRSAQPQVPEGYTKGVNDARWELKQLCKDFSDLRDRPYMGDVYAAIDGVIDMMLSAAKEEGI